MPDQVSVQSHPSPAKQRISLRNEAGHAQSLLSGCRAEIGDQGWKRETSRDMGGRTSTHLELGFSSRLAAGHAELPQQTPSEQT